MSLQSICGKCKTAQLPCNLTVHVKVGDDYKIVCILRAWEIKRLATTVRQQQQQQQQPTGDCSSSILLVPSASLILSIILPSPFPILFKEKSEQTRPLKQQRQ